ncbi:ATP-binding protein [Streptomyces sp. NBC_00414]|uniref:ATP-binding protein n=1 Tax=Streptomyces sp. NBC_00414 TaxID=2975739 RepID=UPI002E231A50
MAIWRSAAEIGLADPDPDHVAWILEELLRVADRSEHLVESLLLLAAADQEPIDVVPLRLDETVADVVADRMREAEQRGITLTSRCEPVTVDGDVVLLSLLVRNLLDNALRYNHAGGAIDVSRDDHAGGAIDVTVTGRTLIVVNTGPFIPGEVAPQLFEPFRRLGRRSHAPGEGAGLGLSIVATIARTHHARVVAGANPDGGMTVTVRFP